MTGTVRFHIGHLHRWTHLVPNSRSDPYRIHQVPCKHKAYPYQFRTGFKRIRSRVNAALVPDRRTDLEQICQAPYKATFTRDRICSDPFGIGSTLVRIHSVYTGPVLKWKGTVLHRITFISGPIWYQTADPNHTGSTRSSVNTRPLSVPIS